MLHSAATMLKIAEMEYSGACSIFLRILFDKKYALPYRVVDSVVFHFIRFRNEKRELPVLWHQSLLTFIQRYKGHISSEQKEALTYGEKWSPLGGGGHWGPPPFIGGGHGAPGLVPHGPSPPMIGGIIMHVYTWVKRNLL